MSDFAVIIPAAGKSTRFGDPQRKKTLVSLAGKPVWMHAVERFAQRKDVRQVLLVIAPEDRELFQANHGAAAAMLGVRLVVGGQRRMDSVRNALERVDSDCPFVAVHDGARPCLTKDWIDRVFDDARQHGAAILAAPITGTVKHANANHEITETRPRDGLWEAQTPQVFRTDWLLEAYARWTGDEATDEARLVEHLGKTVRVTPCSRMNLKITTQDDLRMAQHFLATLPKPTLLDAMRSNRSDDPR